MRLPVVLMLEILSKMNTAQKNYKTIVEKEDF